MAKSDRELMEEILSKTTETHEETKKVTEKYQKVDSALEKLEKKASISDQRQANMEREGVYG